MTENMIHDQASGLRRLTQPSLTKVIAVTGGKGGVGKSSNTGSGDLYGTPRQKGDGSRC